MLLIVQMGVIADRCSNLYINTVSPENISLKMEFS